LRCVTDVIHKNNGNQESRASRILGYAGLKLDHEKAVRSFVNGLDVFESLTTDIR